MFYTKEYVEENYDRLISTETARKLLLSERNKFIDDTYRGYIKNKNEIVFFNIDAYLENKLFYDETYEKIRIYHQTLNDCENIKKLGLKFVKCKINHVIKQIDGDYLEFKGKNLRVERWNKNHYDKEQFRVETSPDNWEGVYDLLRFWDKEKRASGTKMTFTGKDHSFFKRFYDDCKKKYNLLTLYFYDNDKLIAYQVMEQVEKGFWILHTRKTDRFNYSNLNLYVDIYTFRKIWEEYKIPFLIEMGYEMNAKTTEYKEKRFPTHSMIYAYNLTIVNNNTINKLF